MADFVIPGDARWLLVNRAILSWRAWDDEIVLYDDAAGDTHHFNPLAAEVFERLYDEPASIDDLAGKISRALGEPADRQLVEGIATVIGQFRKYGLIGLAAPVPAETFAA